MRARVRRQSIKHILWHVLFLFIIYLLQSAVFSRLRIIGAAPLLLPMAAVGIGLFEGGLRGGIWGIVAGFLCDLSLADSGLLFTVLLTATGLLAGFFAEFILARGFPSFALMSVITLALSAALQLAGFLLKGSSVSGLLPTAFCQLIYSACFIIPMYYPIRHIRP